MARGTAVRALVMGACLVSVGGSAGCQALYGGKPEKLQRLDKKRKPDEASEKAPEIKYVDECGANFRDDPKNAPRADPGRANALIDDGNTAIAQSSKAKDPSSQAALILQSIDKFRGALVKDHYNTEATIRLAIAYDMVYRKGCALALLKRINALESNPKWKSAAKRVADDVADNGQLFKGYRKEAVQAVGR
jgi:hypothetical protein